MLVTGDEVEAQAHDQKSVNARRSIVASEGRWRFTRAYVGRVQESRTAVLAPEQHHRLRGGVRSDAGKREETLSGSSSGSSRSSGASRWTPPSATLVANAVGTGRDSRRERRRNRSRHQRQPSPRGWEGTPPVAQRRLPKVLDERPAHPNRGRPGYVGRADRLDHVLEDRLRAKQRPAHVTTHDNAGYRRLVTARRLIDVAGREIRDAVRDSRSPEIDRLPDRSDEL